MKIENIKFSQEASKRIYNDYMARIKKATNSLSLQNQNDIYMEFNSHIFEAIHHQKQGNEIDSLLDILEKLGTPEEVLKPLVADKKLEEATKSFNPLHIFKALILNFTNGISYIIFFILYLLLFGFVFLIFAKIANPADVGLFYKDDASFCVLGMTNQKPADGVHEILGHYFIPAMLLAIVVFYTIITLLLKLKKTINKK